jgi:hypothetical protein
MITELKLAGIPDKKLNVKKKNVPYSTNPDLPILYFNMLSIGSKGTGKSYNLVKLLKAYEESKIIDKDGTEYEMRIILVCPTAHSGANEVYKVLKNLDLEKDVHLEYSNDLLQAILDDVETDKNMYVEFLEYKKAYEKFITFKRLDKLAVEELVLLEQNEFKEAREVYGDIKPKVNFLIFDDLIGTGDAFGNKKKSLVNNLVIKHRHLGINLIFTTQYLKAIPPIVRSNCDIFVLFKNASTKVLIDKVYPEFGGYIKQDVFEELYEYATDEKNSSLIIINNSMDSILDVRKNWNLRLSS